MSLFATPNNILHVHRYSPNDIIAQCRFEAFERDMTLLQKIFLEAGVSDFWRRETPTAGLSVIYGGGCPTRRQK
jgi:hypothetical protein